MPSEIAHQMDMAAEAATGDLDELLNTMNSDEVEGVKKLVGWITKHYMQAGYKRLAKVLITTFK